MNAMVTESDMENALPVVTQVCLQHALFNDNAGRTGREIVEEYIHRTFVSDEQYVSFMELNGLAE